jgi:DnaJ like chaperone protein
MHNFIVIPIKFQIYLPAAALRLNFIVSLIFSIIIVAMWKIIFIILALLYALNPYDILPDLIVGWGWLDDIVILGLLWRYLHTQKKKREAFQKYQQSKGNAHDFNRGRSHGDEKSRFHDDSGNFGGTWDPYAILEIDRNASPEDIKHAYRRLAGQYHPDKVMHLGEEFKALAEKRFKEIQQAYDQLKK